MNLVLVDSSVWIDYFRGQNNAASDRLHEIIDSPYDLAVCPTIIQEVLQGFRAETDVSLAAFHLNECEKLKQDPYEAAEGTAEIYRKLRKKGLTIRKSSDCLIAWFALKSDCPVLHRDRDFDQMGPTLGLKIFK